MKAKINLSAHIEKLRAEEASKGPKEILLFLGTPADKSYLHSLRNCTGVHTCKFKLQEPKTITEVRMLAKQANTTKVITDSVVLLKKLLDWDERKAPSLDNYAGSYFTLPESTLGPRIEIVFIKPLAHLVTVAYGSFMARRFISKLTEPDKWFKPTAFSWELLTPANESTYFSSFKSAFLISIDIETFKKNATIRCISYTAFFQENKSAPFTSKTVVFPLDSREALYTMRKWNWELQAPKVFQNGKYDNAYLSRYSASVYNWLYDTAHFFHSYHCELPKDLGFLNSFFIREATYWKDLGKSTDLHQYYEYNGLDTWGTGNTLLAMLLEAPKYALENYQLEFPLVFPCHMCEMTGIERDVEILQKARKEIEEKIAVLSTSLNKILGTVNFNVKSPPQKKQLLRILGCGDLKSTSEKDLIKAKRRHPFNVRVLNLVLDIIKLRTAKEKYLQVGNDAKEFHRLDGTGNRILYALNPQGTDTARLASKEHHFWTGLNIQQITRGPSIKQTFKCDSGFALAEVDLEQAESRDTAYISGDENFIYDLENYPDFHTASAAKFFGFEFEDIFDLTVGKVKKAYADYRQLNKPISHGANYNMTPPVLVGTMGEESILQAKKLLKLPPTWSYARVAEYLLDKYHAQYPNLRGIYYPGVISEVKTSHMLISKALHYQYDTSAWTKEFSNTPTWSRYCFKNPEKNKRDLNSYVAHPPQSLNAQTLNKAFWQVFIHIAINPNYADHFKWVAQIHDSIFFQYRIGHEYICDLVAEYMTIPVTIKGYDGEVRSFTVPASIKNGRPDQPALYWSETE